MGQRQNFVMAIVFIFFVKYSFSHSLIRLKREGKTSQLSKRPSKGFTVWAKFYSKNVQNYKGKWRYLVQQSGSNVQEVEVVTCSKNGKSTCRTEEFDDSPSGSGTTTCKQIFSTRKLLAIDEDGVISVDSFQLPSACLCRFLTVRFFSTIQYSV